MGCSWIVYMAHATKRKADAAREHLAHQARPEEKLPRIIQLQEVSRRYCAETGADYDETLETLCWISIECGGLEQGPNNSGLEQWPMPDKPDVDLLSAAAYLGNMSLVKKLLQGGNFNPSDGSGLFDSPMSFAALGQHADIQLQLQEHQVENHDRSRAKGFLREGKVDPGAIVNAAYRGNLELVLLATWPPSREEADADTLWGEGFGCVAKGSRAYECLMTAKHMTSNWEVYRFLAVFLGHYDKVMELEHFDAHLKNTYRAGRELIRRLEKEYASAMMEVDDEEHLGFLSFVDPMASRAEKERLMIEGVKQDEDIKCHTEYGHIDIIRGFLDDGLDPNHKAFQEAFVRSFVQGHVDVMDLLLDRGLQVQPFARELELGNALGWTAEKGYLSMMKKLVSIVDRLDPSDLKRALRGAITVDDVNLERFLLQTHVLAKFGVTDLETAQEIHLWAISTAANDRKEKRAVEEHGRYALGWHVGPKMGCDFSKIENSGLL